MCSDTDYVDRAEKRAGEASGRLKPTPCVATASPTADGTASVLTS